MKRFYCRCGQEVFFENSVCFSCGCALGNVYRGNALRSVVAEQGEWCDLERQQRYRFCQNRLRHDVCNGLVPAASAGHFCMACELNRTIPNLTVPGNVERWRKIEQAKRRLIYGLLRIGLPLHYASGGVVRDLTFDFLQDKRTNPHAEHHYVATGHADGVITLNVLEADDVARTYQRTLNHERYRTILGHLRHECGHYYFELLNPNKSQFIQLFGDPDIPYEQALGAYYRNGPRHDWQNSYITAYASAHPFEDWAECFAHYLHVSDTLETAAVRGVITGFNGTEDLHTRMQSWAQLVIILNELNRSMGMPDAYPFSVNATTLAKFTYINESIKLIAGHHAAQQ
jgi:hypothetical protein